MWIRWEEKWYYGENKLEFSCEKDAEELREFISVAYMVENGIIL